MKFWSKIASAFLVVAGLSIAQTVPGIESPAIAAGSGGGAAATSPSPSPNAANCPPGAAWLCVTQNLQHVMFNPDGTHRSDADIAADAARAITQMIKDGIMKASDAPKMPISGFEDANKYVNSYSAPEFEPLTFTPPPNSAPPVAGPQPAGASATTAGHLATTAVPEVEAPKPTTTKGRATSPPATSGKGKPAPATPDTPMYVFGANDVLGVTVLDEKNVSGTYAIGPDGRISMPLIGTFKAIGLTVPELTELITTKLRDDGGILEPIVNVQLLRNNSKQYTLIGGVMRSGPTPLIRETTILEALAMAGFKEFANQKDIVLRRGTKEFHFSYRDALKGKNMDKNIAIEDGDLIIVKE